MTVAQDARVRPRSIGFDKEVRARREDLPTLSAELDDHRAEKKVIARRSIDML